MPQPAQLSKDKKPDKGKAESKAFAPKHFDPIEHGQVKKRGLLFLFCGVILPTIALLFETIFHFCAHNFFDPFPTASHVVLFALIPLSNFLVWLGTRKDLSNHYAFMSLASGMAMGVSCLYSLMFLPLTPISCFFALALGFGLLGLAPLLSVPCNLIAGKTVCRLADRKGTYFNAHQFEHMGHMIILVMVIAIELPSTLTRINLAKAADKNVIESSAGVAWLRRYGSQEVLLRSCYERSGKATDILGSLYESAHHTTIDQNRKVFFKVTGKPYNSVPIPKAARATIQHAGVISDPENLNAGVDDEFDIDTDIAGEEVCGVARGLSASQSEITGKVDPNNALASLNWTIAFTNDSKFNREARAKILLPPHAVTTKATLTIDDKERDATIMVRSKARARYKKAVMEKKDPLLVSTCGSDQILVQCYPVKPGQTVKVKLQIAAPMTLATNNNQTTLMMPAFLERNFQVDSPVKVNIQSSEPLTAGALESTQTKVVQSNKVRTDAVIPAVLTPTYELKGDIENAQLACFGAVISAPRNSVHNSVSYSGKELPGQFKVTRNLRAASYNGISSLLIVIDGSASMQQSFAQIAEALKAIPPSMSVQIKVVGDTTTELYSGLQQGNSGDVLNAAETLKAMKAEGGQDDSATLDDALSLAAMTNRMSVLWIHAAQPMRSDSTAKVQACLKRSNRPLLFDIQVMAGPNELLNGVNSQKSLVRVDRAGDLKHDLVSFFNACSSDGTANREYEFTQGAPTTLPGVVISTAGDTTDIAVTAQGSTAAPAEENSAQPVDKRLAQIWANERIAEDLQNPILASSAEPGVLAQAFQIISPVSSAIVTDPEEKTLATIVKPKTKFSDRFRKPMGELRAFRQKISDDLNVKANLERNFKSKVDQLNSLSSAASSAQPDQTLSNAPQASYRGKRDNNEQMRAMEESKQIAMSPMGGAKDAEQMKAEAEKGQSGSPILQGATNGVVAQFEGSTVGGSDKLVEGKNFRLEMSSNKKENAAPPNDDGSEISEADESSDPASNAVPNSKTPDANGNFIDANGDTVDADGKPVPEADTWLLLSIIGMIFASTWLNNKKRKAQSS